MSEPSYGNLNDELHVAYLDACCIREYAESRGGSIKLKKCIENQQFHVVDEVYWVITCLFDGLWHR